MTTAAIKSQIIHSNFVSGLRSYKCTPLFSWKTAVIDVIIIAAFVAF